MKLFTAALLATTVTARAATLTESYGPFTLGTAIADNDAVLTSFLHSITGSLILDLTWVEISFELRGTAEGTGFASDLFASLLKSPVGVTPTVSDPSAVLLNRVGLSAGDPVGFGYDGWNVTLSDSAANDIHGESLVSGVLSGTFQPDGRLNPTDSLRPSMLSAFNGGGNGDWRLNVGDLAESGTMHLVSWSLTLTGEDTVSAVPEASTWAAGVGLLTLVGATAWRRHGRI